MAKFDVKTTLITKVIDKNNVEWRTIVKTDLVKDAKGEIDIKPELKTYAKQSFSTTLNAKGEYQSIAKPDISEVKLLTDTESKQVKLALWNDGLIDDKNKVIKEGRKLIFEQVRPAKNDYKHDYDRGTVHFTTTLRADGTPMFRWRCFHQKGYSSWKNILNYGHLLN